VPPRPSGARCSRRASGAEPTSLLVAILLALLVLPSPWGVVAVGAAALFELAEAYLVVRFSRHRRAQVGAETLVGEHGVVVVPCRPDGQIRVRGEIWKARSEEGADVGETVRVLAVDGLTLLVSTARSRMPSLG
jgi:membrane protein implicated in regulation of membrane protease activity